MKYQVNNHHDFWQWEPSNSELQEAEVIFMWADWPFEQHLKALQGLGKKIITFEHGFGALWDYELNHHKPFSDGYMALGQDSKDSLVRCGVAENRVLVTGNPIFDDLKKTKHTGNKALFVALHWVRDLVDYNSEVFEKLQKAYPQFDWTIKLNDKTTEFGSANKWISHTEDSILTDIKTNLPKYDMVFTPRVSTFGTFARLLGIPVYVVDEQQTYFLEGEPNAMPINNTYLKIGDPLPKQLPINMGQYIHRPSLNINDIEKWILTL